MKYFERYPQDIFTPAINVLVKKRAIDPCVTNGTLAKAFDPHWDQKNRKRRAKMKYTF